ncbi:M23 family metallopeptidase [Algicola sagamiensis]|uniref:M23 family metallopeptidase n=1 Tax=Algicola sagamiensis TaxID=163869 RepID=UPI0003A4E2C8|nr:M23 family metallopeptidase [Algicola sagamiensis]
MRCGPSNIVCIEAIETNKGIRLYATSRRKYPRSVRFEFTKLKNLEEARHTKEHFVVQRSSRVRIARLKVKDQSRSWDYDFKIRSTYGDFAVRHNRHARYDLPFPVTAPVKVSQSCYGRFSHNRPGSKHAVDFQLEQGTPVIAARSGVVIELKDNSDKGGPHPKYRPHANYILIMHDDGTYAGYFHLKKGGSKVKRGRYVNQGEVIGYSGNTGYSSGPHLHFVVRKASIKNLTESVKIKFETKDGIVSCPKPGHFVNRMYGG